MPYDLVLFDLDGTLTDSKPGILNSVKYALNAFGKAVPDDDALSLMLGPPIRDGFRDVCGIDQDEVEAVVAKFREYLTNKGMFENEVYPGIRNLLEQLRQNGIKMAVATSKVGFYAEQILNHFKIAQYFDFIEGDFMDGSRSDKEKIIAHVLAQYNGYNAVMIGDRKHDIIGAKANSIDSIAVKWGYGSDEELENVNPTSIASTTEQLYNIICG